MGASPDPNPSSATAVRDGAPTQEDQAALRYAMLSVYYGSLGRQFESRGAPSVLLPLEVRPMELGAALDLIAERFPDVLRDAVWRIVRSVPPPHRRGAHGHYPKALAAVLARHGRRGGSLHGHDLDLDRLDRHRAANRAAANLFGAALVARVEGSEKEFEDARSAVEATPSDFSSDAGLLLGMSATDLLGTLSAGNDKDGANARRLSQLESDVGIDLYDYVAEFSDAVAYLRWWPPPKKRMTVYPAASLISQDTDTLVTTVTVTALVSCSDFATLARSVDPQCWMCASSVVTSTRYVPGSYDLSAGPASPPGQATDDVRFLHEEVTVAWGGSDDRTGAFSNVLRLDPFVVREDGSPKIDLKFSLARSIDSRILWDTRSGGLVVDQGFIKVRPVGPDRWRVTSRKVLKFSDRSPNANGAGWMDFGQMLNYLAPAALTWWLETELYSAADAIYSDKAKVQACLDRHRMGADDGQRDGQAA